MKIKKLLWTVKPLKEGTRQKIEMILGLTGGLGGLAITYYAIFFGNFSGIFHWSTIKAAFGWDWLAFIFAIMGIIGTLTIKKNLKLACILMLVGAVGGVIFLTVYIVASIFLIISVCLIYFEFYKKKHHEKKFWEKPWWIWVIATIVFAYILNGIVFAVIIYKTYPVQMPCKNQGDKQVCKKYPYEQSTTRFMTKVYPFVSVWVNWNSIWMTDYYNQVGYVKHFSVKTQQDIPDDSTIKEQVLNQMIETKLLTAQAKKNKITISKEDIESTYNKLADENGGKDEVVKVLKELYNMTEKEFKNMIHDQLLREKIQKELFVQVHAGHILIKDENKAKEVLDKVKKGEKNFEDLAKEYSEDTGSRDNGGDLNWFGRGSMVKEFENAAFALQPGEISQELVKSEFGFHIIKVIEKKGTLDQSYTDWFNDVKEKAKIYRWVKTENQKNQTETSPASTEATQETSSTSEQTTGQ